MFAFLFLAAGCLPPYPNDWDGDGVTLAGGDCDDTDPSRSPDLPEVCDGADNDCDDEVDEDATDAPTWFPDGDGDGHGRNLDSVAACDAPAGYVDNDGDCDDSEPEVHPGADEHCDGEDEDCDGDEDEDPVDGQTWYDDDDGDGYGDPDESGVDCEEPAGAVDNGDDCDDVREDVNPEATETCDGIDNDCDGSTDGSDAVGASAWYRDADGDGYGDAGDAEVACDEPPGYVENMDDCDDTAGAVYPGAPEVCGDGSVNDCEGEEATGCLDLEAVPADDAVAAFTGGSAGDRAGAALAGGSDLDGDGVHDLVVGTPDAGGTGGAAVLSGSFRGAWTLADGWRLVGTGDGDEAGAAVLSPGDLDGDGAGDILVGAPGSDEAATYAGMVYALAGPITAARALSEADLAWKGSGTLHGLGHALGFVPNAGGGVPAVLAGAWGAADDAGRVYLLDATDGDVETAAKATFTGTDDSLAGSAAASVDRTGDGVDDVVVGAAFAEYGGLLPGAVGIFDCPCEGAYAATDASASLWGTDDGDYAGISLAALGDTDDDGYEDLAVGADGYGALRGAVFVVRGPISTGLLGEASGLVAGDQPADLAGTSVAGPGDVDGDGRDDLLIGAPGSTGAGFRSGGAYLFYGPITGDLALGDAGAAVLGTSLSDQAGFAVAGAGDVDANGLADVLVGAPDANLAGTVYLFLGGGP